MPTTDGLLMWECPHPNSKPYGMWQFTWEAKVDGILGNVDENVCYKDYPQILKKAGLNHLNG